MKLKTRLTHLLLLITILMGFMLAVPVATAEQSYVGESVVLIDSETESVAMGDCGGGSSGCGF